MSSRDLTVDDLRTIQAALFVYRLERRRARHAEIDWPSEEHELLMLSLRIGVMIDRLTGDREPW